MLREPTFLAYKETFNEVLQQLFYTRLHLYHFCFIVFTAKCKGFIGTSHTLCLATLSGLGCGDGANVLVGLLCLLMVEFRIQVGGKLFFQKFDINCSHSKVR